LDTIKYQYLNNVTSSFLQVQLRKKGPLKQERQSIEERENSKCYSSQLSWHSTQFQQGQFQHRICYLHSGLSLKAKSFSSPWKNPISKTRFGLLRCLFLSISVFQQKEKHPIYYLPLYSLVEASKSKLSIFSLVGFVRINIFNNLSNNIVFCAFLSLVVVGLLFWSMY